MPTAMGLRRAARAAKKKEKAPEETHGIPMWEHPKESIASCDAFTPLPSFKQPPPTSNQRQGGQVGQVQQAPTVNDHNGMLNVNATRPLNSMTISFNTEGSVCPSLGDITCDYTEAQAFASGDASFAPGTKKAPPGAGGSSTSDRLHQLAMGANLRHENEMTEGRASALNSKQPTVSGTGRQQQQLGPGTGSRPQAVKPLANMRNSVPGAMEGYTKLSSHHQYQSSPRQRKNQFGPAGRMSPRKVSPRKAQSPRKSPQRRRAGDSPMKRRGGSPVQRRGGSPVQRRGGSPVLRPGDKQLTPPRDRRKAPPPVSLYVDSSATDEAAALPTELSHQTSSDIVLHAGEMRFDVPPPIVSAASIVATKKQARASKALPDSSLNNSSGSLEEIFLPANEALGKRFIPVAPFSKQRKEPPPGSSSTGSNSSKSSKRSENQSGGERAQRKQEKVSHQINEDTSQKIEDACLRSSGKATSVATIRADNRRGREIVLPGSNHTSAISSFRPAPLHGNASASSNEIQLSTESSESSSIVSFRPAPLHGHASASSNEIQWSIESSENSSVISKGLSATNEGLLGEHPSSPRRSPKRPGRRNPTRRSKSGDGNAHSQDIGHYESNLHASRESVELGNWREDVTKRRHSRHNLNASGGSLMPRQAATPSQVSHRSLGGSGHSLRSTPSQRLSSRGGSMRSIPSQRSASRAGSMRSIPSQMSSSRSLNASSSIRRPSTRREGSLILDGSMSNRSSSLIMFENSIQRSIGHAHDNDDSSESVAISLQENEMLKLALERSLHDIGSHDGGGGGSILSQLDDDQSSCGSCSFHDSDSRTSRRSGLHSIKDNSDDDASEDDVDMAAALAMSAAIMDDSVAGMSRYSVANASLAMDQPSSTGLLATSQGGRIRSRHALMHDYDNMSRYSSIGGHSRRSNNAERGTAGLGPMDDAQGYAAPTAAAAAAAANTEEEMLIERAKEMSMRDSISRFDDSALY